MHQSDGGKICTKCSDALVAPEWSEHMDERRVLNLWSCAKCGYSFAEVSIMLPADVETNNEINTRRIFQSRFVA